MNLKQTLQNNQWLTADEQAYGAQLVDEFDALFDKYNVDRTLVLALYAEDVVLSYLIARRIESRLGDEPNPDADTPRRGSGDPALDAAAKARDRWRKAMKELVDYCAKAGAPIDQGLAAVMKPVLKLADGVYEDAVEFETRKKATGEGLKSGA